MNTSIILQEARDLGARDARMIPVDAIRTGAWVSMKCRFGCSHYGKSLCCPPHAPTYIELREVLKEYSHAVLIQCRSLEAATPVALGLERVLFRMGYHKALGFGAGKCLLCPDCSVTLCSQPQNARPSMEACGMDVMGTVKASGMALKGPAQALGSEGEEEIYFGYGLVLVE